MHYGVVSPDGRTGALDRGAAARARACPTTWPSASTTSILNDLPLFWDPTLLAQGVHVPKYHPDIPTRFAVVPRRGTTADIRWFEADPTYVLHWINAYEEGDELVLDGFFQHDPSPAKQPGATRNESLYRTIDLNQLQARPHRWRFNLVTGETKEESLSDRVMEFGMINPNIAGKDYRYTYNMTGKPGWFLFDGLVKQDVQTGREERYAFGDGVFGSETPFAPRPNATAEDDGYLVTFTTDMVRDCSECLIFDAASHHRRADRPSPAARADLVGHTLVLDTCVTARPTVLTEPGATPDAAPNSIGATLGLLGDEWSLLIVRYAFSGARRYGDWKQQLAISDAVLAARLRALVDAGVLRRVPSPTTHRHEYALTSSGLDLWQLLLCIWAWERHHVEGQSSRLPHMVHATCGERFHPVLRCARCKTPTSTDDVTRRSGRAAASSGRCRPGTTAGDWPADDHRTDMAAACSPRRWPSSGAGGRRPRSARRSSEPPGSASSSGSSALRRTSWPIG